MTLHSARVESLKDNINRPTRVISYPKKADGKPVYTSEFFGENVFHLQQIAKALPKPAYASFLKQMRGRQAMDRATADAIAHAVRIWAMDRGATHFTHWFQPQTDTTAEKHDAFLSLKSTFTAAGEEVIFFLYIPTATSIACSLPALYFGRTWLWMGICGDSP